ncbi:MAG: YgjV family protein [Clostridia bacterium]|nr:YgjV family protein [Clostridia bacterium]
MEGISTTYIISQVFVIIMYTLVSLTYYVSNRKTLLIMSFCAIVSEAIGYTLLHAYTGLAMCFVALIRNAIFLVDEKKNGKTEIISKKDIAILLILFSITIISSIFTYDGIFSLLSVFATMLYTYSMWQKKTITYKILRDTSRYFMDII